MYGQTMNNDVTLTGGENPLLAGRYQVVRPLGSGGMGSVWLAEDTLLDNKRFAIKMLPSILVSDKRAYRQLKNEALVAMKLVHPNIMQIRAFEENNGNPFLVMDYIEGQTLDDYLAEKGTLSEDETVRLLKPVAEALDYAHGEGVVHRDVKPANVMIRKDGRPFVLDFGIAREVQESMTRVTGKMSSGTLMYMSPEQLNGMPPAPAQDVYSFAVMVYECLNGAPPFVRGQIEHQILNNPPPPLSSGVASWLSAITMRGLAKKAAERPATCREMLGCGPFGGMRDDVELQTRLAITAYKAEEFEAAFAAAQKADKDDAEIQYIIGRCYQWGDGVEEDHHAAIQWYFKAAMQGRIEALFEIGELYRDKLCDPCFEWHENEAKEFKDCFDIALKCTDARVRRVFADLYVRCTFGSAQCSGFDKLITIDEVEALALIKESANSGSVEAQYELGRRYESGDGVLRDSSEAAKWYLKTAEHGISDCNDYKYALKLGEIYKKGLGVTKDNDEAIKWYRKAVELCANGETMYNLAEMCEIAKKYDEAAKRYQKLAERGVCKAQMRLAYCYAEGKGVGEDLKVAFKWYRKAAEQDNALAQYYVGAMYARGNGVEKNCEEAVKWYLKAAEQGNAKAQHQVGLFYHEGFCVVKDYAQAYKWLQKAADQGIADAQRVLGIMYQEGHGVDKNYEKALVWYQKAVDQGHSVAYYNLGEMYEYGYGVKKDLSQAIKWYKTAAENGNEDGQYNYDRCIKITRV